MNNLSVLPNWFIAVYVALFGLCIGSFLNVVVLRGLKNESFVFERSRCPKCKNQLKWYMNIPIVSYIFLRGKCAFCSQKISIQYPVVEAVTALFFVYSFYKFNLSFEFLFSIIFISLGIVISVCDFLEKVVIDTHVYLITILGITYSFFNCSKITLISSLSGLIIGFLFLELFSRFSKLFLGQRAFGEGDSLILMGLGACFGLKSLVLIFPLAVLFQALLSLPMLVYKSFCEKKINLSVSYAIIFLSIFFVFCLNYFDNFYSSGYYYIFVFVVVITLFYSLINVLIEIKNKKIEFEKLENKDDVYQKLNPYFLFPFGPALISSGIVYLFWLDILKNIIHKFIF